MQRVQREDQPEKRVRVDVRVTLLFECTMAQGRYLVLAALQPVSEEGLLPTTPHSIFYSRVGQIAIFSHWQP